MGVAHGRVGWQRPWRGRWGWANIWSEVVMRVFLSLVSSKYGFSAVGHLSSVPCHLSHNKPLRPRIGQQALVGVELVVKAGGAEGEGGVHGRCI